MLIKVQNKKDLYEKALEIFIGEYKKTLKNRNRFSVAFSGGKTPIPLFKKLSKSYIDWEKVDLFMVDERYLPPENPESNYHVLWTNLLSKIDMSSENIHMIKHMESLETSKIEYETEIKEFIKKRDYSFDLIILGLGKDGHTASIFPDNLNMEGSVVFSLEGPSHKFNRISLSIKIINNSKKKLFLLTKEKQPILQKILNREKFPASSVKGKVIYLINTQ